jgi:hypothetical protein
MNKRQLDYKWMAITLVMLLVALFLAYLFGDVILYILMVILILLPFFNKSNRKSHEQNQN